MTKFVIGATLVSNEETREMPVSFEAQLKANYANAHRRLIQPNYSPKKVLKIIPKIELTPPEPEPEIEVPPVPSTISTASKPTMWQLLKWVSVTEGVSIVELRGAKHSKSIYRVRFIFCYLARVFAGMSLSQIGSFIGGRDHTTVMNAVAKIRVYRLTDPQLCQDVAYYEAELEKGKERPVFRCPHCQGVIPTYPHQ